LHRPHRDVERAGLAIDIDPAAGDDDGNIGLAGPLDRGPQLGA
jgi:hypothetical protein